MEILKKIIAHKRIEVEQRREQIPVSMLEKSPFFERETHSLSRFLQKSTKSGIIAEFKRRSPSKDAINLSAEVALVTEGYVAAGAAALSVLTDERFFGGRSTDLSMARRQNECPVLRKDFVIDEYQILEAKSIGADAILLIAACLDAATLHRLAGFARSLGLEVLVELHDEKELVRVSSHTNVIGVNNRNLKTFEVSIAHSMNLFSKLPKEMVKISESGISNPQAVVELKRVGFEGFLIGERFMKTAQPGEACRTFIEQIAHIEQLLDGAIA